MATLAFDESEMTRRALAAYFRSGGTDQPDTGNAVVLHRGLPYVVLRNVNGVLAVYRIRRALDGWMLRRLKRWPPELEDVT